MREPKPSGNVGSSQRLLKNHGHGIFLAQEPTPAIQKIWRNSMPPRRGGPSPGGITLLDGLQLAYRCPASPRDVTDHQINLSKLVT